MEIAGIKTEKLDVVLTLLEPQLGTVPKSKEVYGAYIADKMREQVAAGTMTQDDFDKRKVTEVETVQETEEKGWTGFHQDDNGLFIYDYMIRGFLKNAGNVLKDGLGLKNVKSKIDNYVFVSPRKIHFVRDGKALKKPDGSLERPLRAQTMQGPRVTLAKSDTVRAGTQIKFVLTILANKDIDGKVIKTLLEYGQLMGLGQFRNGSYGRFEAVVK